MTVAYSSIQSYYNLTMSIIDSVPQLSIHNILFVVILMLISWGFLQQQRRRKNLPPGPMGLPFIGCIPNLAVGLYRNGYAPEKLFAKIARQYGDVFSMYVGNQPVVVVNSCKAITEAFQNPMLNGRPGSLVMEETTMDKGQAFASGKTSKYQRVFTVKTFRGFGIGKTSFDEAISKRGIEMVKIMQEHNGLPFDPHVVVGNCVANIICTVVLGKQYHHTDPQFCHLLEILATFANKFGAGGYVAYIPILRYILPRRYNEIKSLLTDFIKFMDDIREEHVAELSASAEGVHDGKDFIDVYLREIEHYADNKDISPYINNTSLVATTVVLFIAGTETTANTLRWALLYLMTYPEIQTKIQKEMDSVIGRNRGPQWIDKSKLPYTEAVLLEVQRIRTIGPLVPHCATEDTTLLGYDIPEGAIVMGNIWAVHNDGDVWKEPDQFRPERFLDVEGKLRTRAEYMPFSVGRRSCLGENLARMEVFILFTQIIHAFNISFPKDSRYTLEGVNGLTCGPKPFEIVAEKRD